MSTPVLGLADLEAALREEHRRLEQSKSDLEEYQRSIEALQRFASIASHDLREPLQQVAIFTQLLARKHKEVDVESLQYFGFVEFGTAAWEGCWMDS